MKILFLSGWFPYPPVNGARIRIYNLLRQLSRRHEITLLSFVEGMGAPGAQEYLPVLAECCAKVEIVRAKPFAPHSLKAYLGFLSPKPRWVVDTYSPEMARLLQQELTRDIYGVLIASEVGAGGRVTPYAVRVKNIPKVLDAIEIAVVKERFSRRRSLLGQARYGLSWLKFKRYIRETVQQFEACTVPSEQEKMNLLGVVPEYQAVKIIPHGLDLARYQGHFGNPQPDTLVFFGSLTYPVNFDAMLFFLRDVYPLIKREVPGVVLRIIGSTEGTPLEQLAVDDSVVFTGLLLDVRPHVAQSWISIAPLRVGAGTRLKIIEAMALGTPVVATAKGAEGLEVTHGENILIADDPAAFAHHTLELLRNPELRVKLAMNGRKLVEEKYSAETMGRKLDDLLQEVLARKKP